MRRCAVLAALVGVLAVAGAGGAPAASVPSLARRALHDPRALAELRATPVGRVLRGVGGAELAARLRTLASGGPGVTAVAARPLARRILAQRRFRGSQVPEPLHGALVWLGNHAVDPVARRLGWLARRTPGGPIVFWALLAGLVAAAVALLARNLSLRRGGVRVERALRLRVQPDTDPAALEAAADAAERAGELSLALRLRFRAGLLRLARARAIPPAQSLRTGEVRRILSSGEFDALARAFEEVAYGGREAGSDDLAAARAAWSRVLDEAKAA